MVDDCNKDDKDDSDYDPSSDSDDQVVVKLKKQKMSRKESALNRRPWSFAEDSAVRAFFQLEIRNGKNIGKAEALKCKSANPSLANREWKDIKFKVKNLITSTNRALNRAKAGPPPSKMIRMRH